MQTESEAVRWCKSQPDFAVSAMVHYGEFVVQVQAGYTTYGTLDKGDIIHSPRVALGGSLEMAANELMIRHRPLVEPGWKYMSNDS